MDKRELSPFEDQSTDYGPFLNVWAKDQAEEKEYNPYKGVPFNVPPIIPNAVDNKRGGFETDREVRSRHSVLGLSYLKDVMRRLIFWN